MASLRDMKLNHLRNRSKLMKGVSGGSSKRTVSHQKHTFSKKQQNDYFGSLSKLFLLIKNDLVH